ncbi:MAG: rhodanese-like domain-containing protein [Eubacteriales bacterium]|nr:rhodanese-like domain-containing protein [Eubacteriales bacterium]
MKRKLILGLIAGSFCFLAACGTQKNPAPDDKGTVKEADMTSPDETDAYHKISAEKAKEMMDAGGVTIVDVRRADEYAESHVPGAILVPNETIEQEAADALPDKEAVLLIYCRSGNRSKQASDKLVEMGYTQVYDFGGIIDWPYDTESGEAM